MKLCLNGVSARHPSAARDAKPAIQDLDLVVTAGEHVALIGPSGAGKTTLLQILGLSMQPASGELAVDDRNPWTLSTHGLQMLRRRIFFAPQTPPLPPRQRVVTALLAARLPAESLWRSLANLIYPRDIDAAWQALLRFDLAEKLWDRVDRLSGGERQRVGLARALLSPADLWLVDEPLSALDPTRARQAITAVTQAAKSRGATLVTSLHQVDVAVREFPRVIGLRDGCIMFDLPSHQVTPEQLALLYAQHEHELTQTAAVVSEDMPEPLPPKIIHCR